MLGNYPFGNIRLYRSYIGMMEIENGNYYGIFGEQLGF